METQDLTKQFGHGSLPPLAVNEVDLHIGQGQVYGLPGPNGVGRSTALELLAGMLHPASGRILFDGHFWTRDDLYDIGSHRESATPSRFDGCRKPERSRNPVWSAAIKC